CPPGPPPCHNPALGRAGDPPSSRDTSKADIVSEASRTELRAPDGPARQEHVPLAILYMIGATIMFAVSSAASKWLVERYPIGEVLFTRTVVALVTCAIFIMPHTGLAVFRTDR